MSDHAVLVMPSLVTQLRKKPPDVFTLKVSFPSLQLTSHLEVIVLAPVNYPIPNKLYLTVLAIINNLA